MVQGSANKTRSQAQSLRRRADGSGLSLEKVREINKELGLPLNCHAVTTLELNCQCLSEISACLAEYHAVTCLHLECNAISSIQHLSNLKHLKCLYLSHNHLTSMQGLQGLTALRYLDLSNNELTCVEALEDLHNLQALLLSCNQLSTADDLAGLMVAQHLAELDLSSNVLADVNVLQVLAALPALQTLTLMSNPLCEPSAAQKQPLLPQYRRTVISMCSNITALDHRPISPQERAYAQAWWRAQHTQHHDDTHPAAASLPDPAHMPQACCEETACTSASTWGCVGLVPGAAHRDVLYCVLRCLPPRCLVMSCMTCRWWAAAGAPLLRDIRQGKAQAALARAKQALSAADTVLVGAKMEEVQADLVPARPVIQLAHALDILWAKVLAVRLRRHQQGNKAKAAEESAQRDATRAEGSGVREGGRPGCSTPREHAEGNDSIRPGCMSPCCEKGSQASTDTPAPTVVDSHVHEPRRDSHVHEPRRDSHAHEPRRELLLSEASSNRVLDVPELNDVPRHHDSSAERKCDSDANSDADSDGEGDGDAASDGEGDADEELQEADWDSATWRNQAWHQAVPMFKDPALIEDLQLALPLTQRDVTRLRARTGSADDLDVYVPQLRADDVALHSSPAARICQWLLAVEAHAHALYQLDAALTWDWPAQLMARDNSSEGAR